MTKNLINNHPKEGFTNGQGKGFTNGMGKKTSIYNNDNKGMINGNGHVNGCSKEDVINNSQHMGMVNGNGHTNGMVNGTIFDDKKKTNTKLSFVEQKNKPSKFVYVILVVVLLLMSYMIIGLYKPAINNEPNIDGVFNEWHKIDMIDIGFAELGLISDNKTLQLALKSDNMLTGKDNITESYYIFLNDRTSEEGFYLGYDTYEYYIDIYGYQSKLQPIKAYQFNNLDDNIDWLGYDTRYGPVNIRGACNETFLEIDIRSVMLGKSTIENMDLLIYHYDFEGGYKYSQIINIDNVTRTSQVKNTRTSQVEFDYSYDFENLEIFISTTQSLAFSPIPYEIRIMQEPIYTPITYTPTEPINDTTNDTTNDTLENMYIKNHNYRGNIIYIEYYHKETDYIMECGGIIYNCSIVNLTLNDNGITIYDTNRTVKSITINGDVGYSYIRDRDTRSDGTITLFDVSPVPEPLGTITSIIANEYDTTEIDITVDGVLDEYFWGRIPKDTYYIDLTTDMQIFTVRNSTHLFVGVIPIDDGTVASSDECNVYFDTDNDETSTLEAEDKRLSITGAGVITYYEGNAGTWSSTTTPTGWNAGESSTGASRSYEFVIPISDLDEEGLFNSIDSTIGFGVYNVNDESNPPSDRYHLWYPDAYYGGATPTTQYMDDPSTWSDLEYGYNFTDTDFIEFEYYDMGTPTAPGTVTIDGTLNTAEWLGADDWTIDCNGHEAYLYTMKDDTYLYVGWYSRNYDTLGTLDYCQIYFDTDHDNTTALDTADKVLQIDYANNSIYGEDQDLNGNWESQTMPTGWAGVNGITTGNITWEARFTLTDLNENGYFDSTGDSIGFGVMVHHTYDTNDIYYLGYPDSCQHDDNIIIYWVHPESWGDLFYGVVEIPEFTDILPMIIFMFTMFAIFKIKRRDEDNKN